MKVGILGTGHMGTTHARQLVKMPDVQLGYFEANPSRADSFQSIYGAHCCDNTDHLIQWADVIDICLPTDLHLEFALKAFDDKKPVFLEKPVAMNLDDAKRIVEASTANGVQLMIGQVLRYFPEYALANRLVKSGEVGKPAAVRTRRGGPAPTGRSGWFMDYNRSGGVLLDLAIHDFDWLHWTFGEIDYLYSRSVGLQVGSGPDYALTTITFKSGTIAHVEATWMDPSGFRVSYEVAGSEGLIEYDSRKTPELRINKAGCSNADAVQGGPGDPYFLELRAFLDAVQGNTPPPISGRDGLTALSISLAAIESAKTGQVVTPAAI